MQGRERLRRAEDVRVHAVLLGEDEGDNSLRQRCLRIVVVRANKTNVSERGKERGGEEPRRGVQKSKGKSELCRALPAQGAHFVRHARPGTRRLLGSCFRIFFVGIKRGFLSVACLWFVCAVGRLVGS